MPEVSIVTPLYNSCDFLEKTISSIQAQTYENWELIIIDDCSSDNSYELARLIAKKDSRISVYRLANNSGPAIARNFGIERASSRFISFLDSDDQWYEEKLERQLDFMRVMKAPLSYTAYDVATDSGEYLRTVGVPKSVSYESLLKTCVIGCLTATYDSGALGKVYMPLIRKRQDFGLWLKILKVIECGYGLNVPLARYTLRESSVSSNKSVAAQYTWKLYREVEGLNIFQSGYYFSHYAVRGLMRNKFPRLARGLGVLLDPDQP